MSSSGATGSIVGPLCRRRELSRGQGGKDMALKQIVGLDHMVVLVRDLDGAAETWRRLGFTLAPRGTHSAHMGTGNYTIMFDPDYMELLGVLTPNAPARSFLEKRGE